MKKIIIDSNIHVYQNALKDPEKIIDLLKTDRKGMDWKDWAGLWKGKALKIPSNYSNKNYDLEVLEALDQIKDVFDKVVSDYLNEYKNENFLPKSIKKYDNFNKKPWVTDENIDFLKYNKEQPEHLKSTKLAMNYHTDYNNFNDDAPQDKKIITVTIYLNDNYKGGEISIYCPNTNKLYNYKPKAGDITVFPSGHNYYHGVLPFFEEDRYLVRMFKSYKYKGSKSWWENRKLYGEKKWDSMEKEKLQKMWESGINLINIVQEFEEPIDLRLNSIYLDSSPIYINGEKNDY